LTPQSLRWLFCLRRLGTPQTPWRLRRALVLVLVLGVDVPPRLESADTPTGPSHDFPPRSARREIMVGPGPRSWVQFPQRPSFLQSFCHLFVLNKALRAVL